MVVIVVVVSGSGDGYGDGSSDRDTHLLSNFVTVESIMIRKNLLVSKCRSPYYIPRRI
jgi:hypothetical protein